MQINQILSSKYAVRVAGIWNPATATELPDSALYAEGNVLRAISQGYVGGRFYLQGSFLYKTDNSWLAVNNVSDLTGLVWDIENSPNLPSGSYPFALLQVVSNGRDSNNIFFANGDIAVVSNTGTHAINLTRLNYTDLETVINFFTNDDTALVSDTGSYENVYTSFLPIPNFPVEYQAYNISGTVSSALFGVVQQGSTVADLLAGVAPSLIVNLQNESNTIIIQKVIEGQSPEFQSIPFDYSITASSILTFGFDSQSSELRIKIDDEIVSGITLDLTDFPFSSCVAASIILATTSFNYSVRFTNIIDGFGYATWQEQISKFNGTVRIIDTNYTSNQYPQSPNLGDGLIFSQQTTIDNITYKQNEGIFWDGETWKYFLKLPNSLVVQESPLVLINDSIVKYNYDLGAGWPLIYLGNDTPYHVENLVISNSGEAVSHFKNNRFSPLFYTTRTIFPEKYFSGNIELNIGDRDRTRYCLNFEYTVNFVLSSGSGIFGIYLHEDESGNVFTYPNTLIGTYPIGSLAILYDHESHSFNICTQNGIFSVEILDSPLIVGDIVNFVVGEAVPDPNNTIPNFTYKIGIFVNGIKKFVGDLSDYLPSLLTSNAWTNYARTFYARDTFGSIGTTLNTGQLQYRYRPSTSINNMHPALSITNNRNFSGFVFDDTSPLETITKEASTKIFATKLAKKVDIELNTTVNSTNYENYLDKLIKFNSTVDRVLSIDENTPDGFQCVVFQVNTGKLRVNYSGTIYSYQNFIGTNGIGSPMTIQKLGGELFLGGILGA